MASGDCIYMNSLNEDVKSQENVYYPLRRSKVEEEIYEYPDDSTSNSITKNAGQNGTPDTDATSASCRSKKTFITVAIILLLVVCNIVTGVGLFLLKQQKQGINAAPVVVCPSVPSISSNVITFRAPVLVNFPNKELVQITYRTNGRIIGSFASTEKYHELNGFDGGATVVKVVAKDAHNGYVASCDFIIYHTPEIVCPTVNATSTSLSFPRPVANFEVKSPYYYSIKGELFRKIPPEATYHQMLSIPRSHLPNITISVAGESSQGAHCTFDLTEGVPIRLVGGANQYEGRVEIYYNEKWGTVCDDEWDSRDASVVCRQLGLPFEAAKATARASFGEGSGPIWLDNVDCMGSESYLESCSPLVWALHNCAHREDAGVICTDEGFPIRLVGGANQYKGRVEIYYNKTWGTVCDDNWDSRDATVVCKQLGLPYKAAQATARAFFGKGSGPIWLDDVNCVGSEYWMESCSLRITGHQSYMHSEDAGVICRDTGYEFPIRLVGGAYQYEGRVEIYFNGTWGTVCDDNWDSRDATVVCRQLGLPHDAAQATTRAFFGEGSGPIWLANVACMGSEHWLESCNSRNPDQFYCQHSEDAGVICTDEGAQVRLVDGSNPYEGRVEVFYKYEWGTVCYSGLGRPTEQSAIVICRQLGLPYGAAEAFGSSTFGTFGSRRVWLDRLSCTGLEDHLSHCEHPGWGVYASQCSDHSLDVGVVCKDGPNYIRLVDGNNGVEGRVEIMHNGVWGSICSNNWDVTDAIVTCRQLGLPYDAPEAIVEGSFGEGTGKIWMDNVQCDGSEDELSGCSHNGWGNHVCGHHEDVGVVCK